MYKGAAKLIRWLDGDEPKADMIGIPMEEKLDEVVPSKDPKDLDEPVKDVKEKTLPKAPEPNNKEALTEDSKCAASLQRIEKQMAQLITCMSDLAASIKEAPESRRGKERSEKNDKSEASKKSRSTKKAGEEKAEE